MGSSRQEYWSGLPFPSPSFLYNFFLFLFFWLCGGFAAWELYSSWGEQGPLSSCGTQPSRCSGFSRCRAQALGHAGFSICGSQALEHRLYCCGTQVYLLCGMRGSPRLGIKPTSPRLAGRFFTTELPEKPWGLYFSNVGMWNQKRSYVLNLPFYQIIILTKVLLYRRYMLFLNEHSPINRINSYANWQTNSETRPIIGNQGFPVTDISSKC